MADKCSKDITIIREIHIKKIHSNIITMEENHSFTTIIMGDRAISVQVTTDSMATEEGATMTSHLIDQEVGCIRRITTIVTIKGSVGDLLPIMGVETMTGVTHKEQEACNKGGRAL